MTESQVPGDHIESDHLEAQEVAGFLSNTLPLALRQRVERHLADCEDCTAELVAVHRLRRPRRSSVRWLTAGAAAAAAIGVLLLGPSVLRRTTLDGPPVRGREPAVVVRAVAPMDGAALEGAVDFVWYGVPGATTYRVSVSRADGDSVWAVTTPDTSIHVGKELLGAGGGPYYWYVDVLLRDGRSVAGSVHEFRIRP